MAFAIGTSVGNAPERNRLRRVLRASIRETAFDLPSGAYLIGARPPVAALGADELRVHLHRVLEQATSGGVQSQGQA